jgi:hypothetical protein
MHCLLLVALALSTAADEKPLGPAQAKTTAELVTAISERAPRFLTAAGLSINSAEFHRAGRRVFLAWYCPTSGRATCQVLCYEFDSKAKVWKLLRQHLFEDTQDISPEFTLDYRLRLRDVQGKEIYYESEWKE